MAVKNDVLSFGDGMAPDSAAGDLNQNRDRLTAMARVPTRSVRPLMAPRCSDPITKRRSRHTRLPQSDISGRGEPPVLLNWRDQFF
jgi:hypothetical protein